MPRNRPSGRLIEFKAMATPEHPNPLPALAAIEGDIGKVVLKDLETVGKESVQRIQAQWKGRTRASRVERRIDVPHTDDQPALLQG